jgi:GWxTD domain-containing protein
MIRGLTFFFLFALSVAQISAMDVSVSSAVFQASDKNYLELHFHFVASTLEFTEADRTRLQAKVESTILIKQGDKLISFDKYELSSPLSIKKMDFQDVKRFSLEPGEYELDISIVDKNDTLNVFNLDKKITIAGKSTEMSISDIQFFASIEASEKESNMTKSGFKFEALPYDYLDSKYDLLHFYTEVYSNGSYEDSYLDYKIYTGLSSEAETEKHQVMKGIKKTPNDEVFPFLKSLDISNLISGNYHLSIQLKNREKEVISSTTKNFKINNPNLELEILKQEDDQFSISFTHTIPEPKLNYYLRAHIPIISSAYLANLNEIIRSGTTENKRYFIHQHWYRMSEEHARELFDKYMEVADAIDKMYNSGFGYGFETDRGFMYLKYGRPTQSITVTDEISAPPYEIWAYDFLETTNQNNVKFIFYNPSLSHNDFKLLHSTCRGEQFNPAWEVELYRDAVSEDNGSSIDATSVQDNFNRNARRLFNDL